MSAGSRSDSMHNMANVMARPAAVLLALALVAQHNGCRMAAAQSSYTDAGSSFSFPAQAST